MEERLDIYLYKNNFVPSRNKAQELIKDNKVYVNNKLVNKESYQVKENDEINIIENKILKYVSRGGLKLEKALEVFNINLENKVILDIGASKGGFTDCALQNKAKLVYALDVGTNQLDKSLIDNNKVINMENINFKDVDLSMFKEKIDYFVTDVSFISIRKIIDKLLETWKNFKLICLFKPEFEVGKNKLNANGVVKSKKFIIEALNDFENYLIKNNLLVENVTYSPIKGNKKGNSEYLFYIYNGNNKKHYDYNKIVEESLK